MYLNSNSSATSLSSSSAIAVQAQSNCINSNNTSNNESSTPLSLQQDESNLNIMMNSNGINTHNIGAHLSNCSLNDLKSKFECINATAASNLLHVDSGNSHGLASNKHTSSKHSLTSSNLAPFNTNNLSNNFNNNNNNNNSRPSNLSNAKSFTNNVINSCNNTTASLHQLSHQTNADQSQKIYASNNANNALCSNENLTKIATKSMNKCSLAAVSDFTENLVGSSTTHRHRPSGGPISTAVNGQIISSPNEIYLFGSSSGERTQECGDLISPALTLSSSTLKQNAAQTPKALLNVNGSNVGSGFVTLKQHSAKCNIMLRKMRRGNKRSKSLPAKFNIDSVLEYLNYSMILNKYELRKQLNQQRNLLLFVHNSSSNNSSSSNHQLNQAQYYNQLENKNLILNAGKISIIKSKLDNKANTYQQFSSGYNSENHSNSSQCCTATNLNTYNQKVQNSDDLALLNFYRLTLNHLPTNFSNTLCTCHATANRRSGLNLSTTTKTQNPVSSSPIITNEDEDLDEDDFDDEDEDLDEEIEEDDETNKSPISSSLLLAQNKSKLEENEESSQQKITLDLSEMTSNSSSGKFQRAPGTSSCVHTAKIDLRRVRSYQDLTQAQILYTQNDFVFKEKLGEGFFANVKKIVSKVTRKEMVLKELKLNCVDMNSSGESMPNQKDALGNESSNNSNLSKANNCSTFNYAELNAAHKSFLKEAQVLRNLNHPNVIKLLGILFTKQKHLNLVLEYISGGTLKDIIHNISIALPWKLRVGYAKDIASAMQYLHSLNIIHRDLKSDNCLVRENGRSVVVADFGLSRIINSHYSSNTTIALPKKNLFAANKNNNNHLCDTDNMLKINNSVVVSTNLSSLTSIQSGTNSFIVAAKRKLKRRGENHQRKQRYAVVGNSFSMAPEMLKHELYDERVDIFSFGIICCEIIGRVQADPDYLPRTSDFGLNVELFRKKYCEADCPKHFIKIAIACCELEPEKRPPFSKTHVWLETILSHLETNNPIPKNLLKNILESNTKRPPVAISVANSNT